METAGFRRACNKRLRGAFCRLADSSRRWHPWAQDLYAQTRQRHRHHPHLVGPGPGLAATQPMAGATVTQRETSTSS
jgi:hypothetical protein